MHRWALYGYGIGIVLKLARDGSEAYYTTVVGYQVLGVLGLLLGKRRAGFMSMRVNLNGFSELSNRYAVSLNVLRASCMSSSPGPNVYMTRAPFAEARRATSCNQNASHVES